jgi:hypothetical protein
MDTNGDAYEDGQVFKAQIIDQMVTYNPKGEAVVLLTVKVLAKLANDRNPGDGTVPCPQRERLVWLALPEDDDDRLRMAVRDLERMGFADDDVSRLHPEHPTCFSVIEKEVHVRIKVINDLEYWNLAWPREKPKPVAVEELKKATESLKGRVAAARQRLKEGPRKGKNAAGPGQSGAGE